MNINNIQQTIIKKHGLSCTLFVTDETNYLESILMQCNDGKEYIAFRNSMLKKQCENCGKKDMKLTKCKHCKKAVYCSKKCQHLNWIRCHRNECKLNNTFD